MNLSDLILIDQAINTFIKEYGFKSIEQFCAITKTNYDTIFICFKSKVETYNYFKLLKKC